MEQQTASRWLISTGALGFVTWLAVWAINLSDVSLLSEIERLLYFGVAVTTPLAMRLALRPDRENKIAKIYQVAIRAQPFAIAATGGALLLTPGPLATAFACIWLMQTTLLALHGLQQLLSRPAFAIEETCIDAGLIYVPISAIWLIANTADYPLLTFDRVIILLTAVHFTFISPGALVLAGMAGRQLFQTRMWALYQSIASLAVISPMLVAFGITFTQVAGFLLIEAVAVIVRAGSFLMLAALIIAGGLPKQPIARLLLIASLSALAVTMLLALAYSIGRLTNWWVVQLNQMVQWHGWLNAAGFTFLGLIAWNIAKPEPHTTPMGIRFSRLPWRWRIRPDFLQRINAIDSTEQPFPTGIVDDLTDYERTVFPQMLSQTPWRCSMKKPPHTTSVFTRNGNPASDFWQGSTNR